MNKNKIHNKKEKMKEKKTQEDPMRTGIGMEWFKGT